MLPDGRPIALYFSVVSERKTATDGVVKRMLSCWVGREDVDEGALGVVNLTCSGTHNDAALRNALLQFSKTLWRVEFAPETLLDRQIDDHQIQSILDTVAYRHTTPRKDSVDYVFDHPIVMGASGWIRATVADRTRLRGGYWGWYANFQLQSRDRTDTQETLLIHADPRNNVEVGFDAFFSASAGACLNLWRDFL